MDVFSLYKQRDSQMEAIPTSAIGDWGGRSCHNFKSLHLDYQKRC